MEEVKSKPVFVTSMDAEVTSTREGVTHVIVGTVKHEALSPKDRILYARDLNKFLSENRKAIEEARTLEEDAEGNDEEAKQARVEKALETNFSIESEMAEFNAKAAHYIRSCDLQVFTKVDEYQLEKMVDTVKKNKDGKRVKKKVAKMETDYKRYRQAAANGDIKPLHVIDDPDELAMYDFSNDLYTSVSLSVAKGSGPGKKLEKL